MAATSGQPSEITVFASGWNLLEAAQATRYLPHTSIIWQNLRLAVRQRAVNQTGGAAEGGPSPRGLGRDPALRSLQDEVTCSFLLGNQ